MIGTLVLLSVVCSCWGKQPYMGFISNSVPGVDEGNDEAENAGGTKRALGHRFLQRSRRPRPHSPALACDLVLSGALAIVRPLTCQEQRESRLQGVSRTTRSPPIGAFCHAAPGPSGAFRLCGCNGGR